MVPVTGLVPIVMPRLDVIVVAMTDNFRGMVIVVAGVVVITVTIAMSVATMVPAIIRAVRAAVTRRVMLIVPMTVSISPYRDMEAPNPQESISGFRS